MGVLGGECAYVKLAHGCYCFRVFGWRREYVMDIICGSVRVTGFGGIGGIGGVKEGIFIRWGSVGRTIVDIERSCDVGVC